MSYYCEWAPTPDPAAGGGGQAAPLNAPSVVCCGHRYSDQQLVPTPLQSRGVSLRADVTYLIEQFVYSGGDFHTY